MRDDTVLALIERIYDAALDPSHLPQALAGIGQAVGGVQECLFAEMPDSDSFGMVAPRRDPDFISRFYDYWAADDCGAGWELLGRKLLSMPTGRVQDIRAVLETTDFSRTAFYNDWWRAQGLGDATLMVKFACRSGGWGICGIHRSRGGDDFADEEINLFGELAPHIMRAVSLQHELACLSLEHASSNAAGNDNGLVLVDAAGKVVYANGVAESWFAQEGGLRFAGRRLTLADAVAARQLDQRIGACVNRSVGRHGPGGTLLVPRRWGRRPLLIDVVPFPPAAAGIGPGWLALLQPVALLVITDPDRDHRRRREALRKRFGLTPAEAEFALEILKGDGREAAAGRLGISLSTARTHLTRIFGKTGVRRQAELVYLLGPLN